MRYTALLFDLDHTLLDSDASESLAFAHALAGAGIAEPARYLPAYVEINRALWTRVERGELSPNHVRTERFAQLIAATGLAASAEALADAFAYGLGAFGELYPGVPAVLDALAGDAGLSIGLITNGISDIVRARVARLGLARYFRWIAVSSELGVAKPDRAIFDHVLARMGSPSPPSVLVIGDSLSSDMRGGRNAGLATCWYNPRGHAGDVALIDHEIADHDALHAIVRGEPRS